MRRAEVVDRSSQVHSFVQRRQSASRASAPPPQTSQSLTKRGVQPLDVGRVEHLTAGRAPQQRQEQACVALNKPMKRSAHRPACILLDHLGQHQLRPLNQARACACPALSAPKGPPHGLDIRAQAIRDEQQRPKLGARRNKSNQPRDQVAVAARADHPAEPQPGADHQRHRHPHNPLLGLDPDLVGLYLHQVARLKHELVMNRFGMPSAGLHPGAYGLGLEAKGHLNRRDRAAVVDQGHHASDRLLIGAPPVEGCSRPRTERLLADLAPVALALTTVDADVAFTDLAPCRTVRIRAKCCLRIDGTPPLGPKHRKCAPIRSGFQVHSSTTVQRTPTR